MNQTYLNLADILKDYADAENLGQLFRQVEDRFATQGQLVCQFVVNGMVLTEEDEARMSDAPFDEIKTLEIHSENPAILLFSLLENWASELPQLTEHVDQLAKDIKFKGMEGRLKPFIDMIDSCQFLIESLMNLESILKKESMDIENWKKNKSMTARAIGDALSAFEKKDFVLLSEVLEYDLCHSLMQWHNEICNMQEYLKKENDRDKKEFTARIFAKQPSAGSDKENSCT